MFAAFIIMTASVWITFSVIGTTVAFRFSITPSVTATISFIAFMTTAITVTA